jgi:Ca2+-dependent lipid-binding protein
MAQTSTAGDIRPAIRVYIVSAAMLVGAVASFAAGVAVLGIVFLVLMIVAGVTAYVLMTGAKRRLQAGLRAAQAQQEADVAEKLRNLPRREQ